MGIHQFIYIMIDSDELYCFKLADRKFSQKSCKILNSTLASKLTSLSVVMSGKQQQVAGLALRSGRSRQLQRQMAEMCSVLGVK